MLFGAPCDQCCYVGTPCWRKWPNKKIFPRLMSRLENHFFGPIRHSYEDAEVRFVVNEIS